MDWAARLKEYLDDAAPSGGEAMALSQALRDLRLVFEDLSDPAAPEAAERRQAVAQALRGVESAAARVARMSAGPQGQPGSVHPDMITAIGRALEDIEARSRQNILIGYQRCLADLGLARDGLEGEQQVAIVQVTPRSKAQPVRIAAGTSVPLLPSKEASGGLAKHKLFTFGTEATVVAGEVGGEHDGRGLRFTVESSAPIGEFSLGLRACPIQLADVLGGTAWGLETAAGAPQIQLVPQTGRPRPGAPGLEMAVLLFPSPQARSGYVETEVIARFQGLPPARRHVLLVELPHELLQDWAPRAELNVFSVLQQRLEVRIPSRTVRPPLVRLDEVILEHFIGAARAKSGPFASVRGVAVERVTVDGRWLNAETQLDHGLGSDGYDTRWCRAGHYRLLPAGVSGDPPRLFIGGRTAGDGAGVRLDLVGSSLLDFDWPRVVASLEPAGDGYRLDLGQAKEFAEVQRIRLIRTPAQPLRRLGRLAGLEGDHPLRSAIGWLTYGRRGITRRDFEEAVAGRFREVKRTRARFSRWRDSEGRVRAGVEVLVEFREGTTLVRRDALRPEIESYVASICPIGYSVRCELASRIGEEDGEILDERPLTAAGRNVRKESP